MYFDMVYTISMKEQPDDVGQITHPDNNETKSEPVTIVLVTFAEEVRDQNHSNQYNVIGSERHSRPIRVKGAEGFAAKIRAESHAVQRHADMHHAGDLTYYSIVSSRVVTLQELQGWEIPSLRDELGRLVKLVDTMVDIELTQPVAH